MEKSKSEITSKCNSLGVTCNFTYQTSETIKKDVCIKQSSTGTVNKGSKITITLSSGAPGKCTIIIDANQLTGGNAEATKKTLETKQMTYYSRSRKSLWVKGETSGYFQKMKGLAYVLKKKLLEFEPRGDKSGKRYIG